MVMGCQTGCGTVSYINPSENGTRIERIAQGKQGMMALFGGIRGTEESKWGPCGRVTVLVCVCVYICDIGEGVKKERVNLWFIRE